MAACGAVARRKSYRWPSAAALSRPGQAAVSSRRSRSIRERLRAHLLADAKAAGQKLLRTARLRADTTVIPANVAYPTDSGPLAKAVGKMARTVRRVQAAVGATRTRARDGRRGGSGRSRTSCGPGQARPRGSTRVIARVTGELADLAKTAAAEAAAVLRNGRPALPAALSERMRGRLRRALDELGETIGRAAPSWPRTRSRLGGQLPDSATRLVSLHDGDARDP